MKFISVMCASALALSSIGTANAQTYRPAGTFTFSGTVAVKKGISLTCTLTVTLVVPEQISDGHTYSPPTPATAQSHGHSATATPVLSGGLCGSVKFIGAPYAVSYNGTNLTLSNVNIQGITGNCLGNIGGVWNAGSPPSLAINASVPSSPAGGTPCTVVGTITQTSPATPLVITNP